MQPGADSDFDAVLIESPEVDRVEVVVAFENDRLVFHPGTKHQSTQRPSFVSRDGSNDDRGFVR